MRPDFSGVWKLIQQESQFGYLVPPRFRADTIEHRDPKLRILTQQIDTNGDVSVERRLVLGGDPIFVKILGRERMVTARWDGDEIVMGTRSDFNGYSRLIEDRLRMAADRESIVISRRHELPGGAVRQRLLLRRF